jgi:cytochrome c553
MVPRKRFTVLTMTVAFGAWSIAASAQSPPPAQTPKFADTIEQRVAACAICHGKLGEGSGAKAYYPRIAGKPARYLYLQLQNFREGRRSYPQMIYLMRYMPDAYLQEIADYYAKLSPPYTPPAPPPASPGELARGETLVTKGDAAKRVPACNACHGSTLGGMQPAIPGLVGLGFDYISAQLGAWKTGARAANAPDCMHEIASRLTAADISAVSKWIATQPGSAAAKAVPEAAHKLPLSCGSQTR